MLGLSLVARVSCWSFPLNAGRNIMRRPTIDDAFDEHGMLKDGRIARVRMSMKDAMKMRDRPTFDAAKHRPGFRLGDGKLNDARRAAYIEYENWITNRWHDTDQDNPPTGAGSHWPKTQSSTGEAPAGAYPYTPAAEGKSCTINGFPGHLRRKGDWLVCVPDRQDFNGSNGDDEDDPERAQSDKTRAYAEYDAQLVDAYKRVR
jgi:hypothetical protein